MAHQSSIAIVGARVVDPLTGLDGVRNVILAAGRVAAVSTNECRADEVIDARGLMLGPGFIDMHSHAQSITGHRLQALDGVTSALDLEEGALPVRDLVSRMTGEGRPLNFGFSASWVSARMHVLDGAPLRSAGHPLGAGTALDMFSVEQTGPRWGDPATREEQSQILALLAGELDRGAIGVGVLLGYAPGAGIDEIASLGGLAADRDKPLFVHARSMAPAKAIEAVEELIDVARSTRAHIHLCHLNSTSHKQSLAALDLIRTARAHGIRLTTEAYPYGYGCTQIGAAFLAPESLEEQGLSTLDICYLPTGERVSSALRLRELRALDPAGLVTVSLLDDSDQSDQAVLLETLAAPETVIASDAMPLTGTSAALQISSITDSWPIPGELLTHPRSAGCYSRSFRMLVREQGMPAAEFFRKASLLPAQILERSVPGFAGKGRLSVGADADIVVLDPAAMTDRATPERVIASSGVEHLFIGGVPLVTHGAVREDALPGRALLSRPT